MRKISLLITQDYKIDSMPPWKGRGNNKKITRKCVKSELEEPEMVGRN